MAIPSYATLTTLEELETKRDLNGISKIDPLRDPRWNDLVERHPKASVFHSVEWLRALHQAYRYEPVAMCISGSDGRLNGGLVFCQIKSWLTGARLVSLPFSDYCEPLIETPEELRAILQQLKTVVKEGNWDYLEVRPTLPQVTEDIGFQPTSTYLLHALDLSRDSNVIFRSLHKDCVQRKIRRAERESLEYQSGNSEELLLKFYRLLVITRRRHGLPPQPRSWFHHLSQSFGNKLQFRIASHKGQPVAAILTLKHGKTITYKYGSSDGQWNKLGGTALLFWRTIEEAKAEGLTQFELGRSDPNNQGLIDFKDHWGTQRSSLSYWRYSLRARQHRPAGNTLPRNLVEFAPDWALRLIGELLYRHIG